ncbi:hypothetical protein CNE_1c00910 [Cupriavidus necator N-1]|jgi:hypothetical protein|uniref:Uncharacterized protein n=1 Tax=Cupriavidus necator (strain ATCC 43291 / DSM 13513 / CCUG 52238 / LMG 8453 / N-1) TaxID=1042878 RepID=G0ESI6_CUPNN|nr:MULTISPECIES: hypothetical protein [Cupriavidus]AEI75460.1 hypothetical protein CNE_1c00910 [Cupriavidus necator N-1]MDX6012397.1 hypothetical protein [Cupriavidus necator]QUN28471.1 hypothetical protein KB879_00385 [Cupriavidus sp. KK10]
MQSVLSVLAILIMVATIVGVVSPAWLSQTLFGGRPVTRLQVVVIGVCLAGLCLVLVGRLAQGGGAGG